jgi:hypothetical protein
MASMGQDPAKSMPLATGLAGLASRRRTVGQLLEAASPFSIWETRDTLNPIRAATCSWVISRTWPV